MVTLAVVLVLGRDTCLPLPHPHHCMDELGTEQKLDCVQEQSLIVPSNLQTVSPAHLYAGAVGGAAQQ